MASLSDVQLGKGLLWTDRWGQQKVEQTMIRTLGGLPVFYHATLTAGHAVTLESLEDQGWQTLETVEALFALAAVPGAQYLLDLGPTQFSVMFRHTDGAPLEVTPLIPRTNYVAGDLFTVKIKLVTV